MPRPTRDEESGAVHHVVAQGNGRTRIVMDDFDGKELRRRLSSIAHDLDWVIHTDALMDTHHHVIVETAEPNLGRGFQRLLGGYAWVFNRRHGREGHLFHGPYWSRRIADDGHLFTACVYAVLNPVAAGLCSHPREWPWSSYHEIAGGNGSRLLMEMFGSDLEEATLSYIAVVEELAAQIVARRAEDARSLWALSRSVIPRELQGSG
jgi:putative transposase